MPVTSPNSNLPLPTCHSLMGWPLALNDVKMGRLRSVCLTAGTIA